MNQANTPVVNVVFHSLHSKILLTAIAVTQGQIPAQGIHSEIVGAVNTAKTVSKSFMALLSLSYTCPLSMQSPRWCVQRVVMTGATLWMETPSDAATSSVQQDAQAPHLTSVW